MTCGRRTNPASLAVRDRSGCSLGSAGPCLRSSTVSCPWPRYSRRSPRSARGEGKVAVHLRHHGRHGQLNQFHQFVLFHRPNFLAFTPTHGGSLQFRNSLRQQSDGHCLVSERIQVEAAPWEDPSQSALRRNPSISRLGGAPNSRVYSRLNCEGLS
jgi:hypothetical protein